MKRFWKIVLGSFLGTLIALVVLTLIMFGAIGSIASLGSSEAPAVSDNSILKIDMATGITEQGSEDFTFDLSSRSASLSTSLSLLNAVRAIDQAAEDPSIKMIYIRCDGASGFTFSQAEEIRKALVNFRESGKPVVAYMSQLSSGMYYFTSVADKVILNAYADCLVSGMSSTMMYYKDLIDALGIDIQLIRHGKYKSAGEPYIRSDMSEANREQYEVLLNSIWSTIVESIASSRDFTAEDYNSWVDNLTIGSVEAALEKGLVDELWFDDQVSQYLCTLTEVEEEKDLKFVSLSNYAKAKVKPNVRAKDKIAVVYADGEIMMGESGNGIIGDKFSKEIEKVRKDSTIKAVVFRVNSPGGSVQASAIIEREIELLKAAKPVIASYGSYAASGGYWISCASDKIFSDNTTLTGSIGVFGLIPSFGRALKKNLHLNVYEVSTHKHGAMINGYSPLDADEERFWQNNIEGIYTDFVGRVAEGRDMSPEDVDNLGQGRVWSGRDAIKIGLVDEIGGLADAISYAAAAVGLEEYQTVEYPVVKSAADKLMESLLNSKARSSAMPDCVSQAEQWLSSISEPQVVARMDNIIIQ